MRNFLKAWFEPPFRLILLVMEIYKANTARFGALMGKGAARRIFNIAAVITVLLWLAIFVFMGEEHRSDLTDAIQEMLPFSDEE